MAKTKKRENHSRDWTICGLACFAFSYVVAGALMASPGIRVVLEYPLFKTGSVIWGGILVFAIGLYILGLCRCMEYINKLKVAVILIMQILVCAVCIANIPILKCVEWEYFTGKNEDLIEDNNVIYIAYLLTLVGTVIGLVSSIFGILYTVVITNRIRSRLKHYMADLERIHQSSERKMSPIYDDATGEITRQIAGIRVNVSPGSWVFHEGSNSKSLRTELSSPNTQETTLLPVLNLSAATCSDDTMVTSQESMQNRFMDKRLARQQPLTKHQTNEPLTKHQTNEPTLKQEVAIQDYLPHEEKTLIPPNPSLRYDQVLFHPSTRPPSVISIISDSSKRRDSLSTEAIVGETGLNTTDWGRADHSPSKWPSPPTCVKLSSFPNNKNNNKVLNDELIPAPPRFQDQPANKKNKERNLRKCLVPEIIIARPPEPPKCIIFDENDNTIVSAYRANSLMPCTFQQQMFKPNVQAVKPLMTDFESPMPPDLSRQGSMCNLMGNHSPLFDMSYTRL
ncbi:uncharacterized protein [Antedon mediterranea]|uniref:uncharacterized protein n=1 Tax=Antedon mediterranea TaxID=105859 RepID=UPI003AF550E2